MAKLIQITIAHGNKIWFNADNIVWVEAEPGPKSPKSSRSRILHGPVTNGSLITTSARETPDDIAEQCNE